MDYNIANTYMPGLPAFDVKAFLLAVLVVKDDKYRCYLGLVPERAALDAETREKYAHMVAQRGTKQTLEKAKAFFPALSPECYAA